MLWVLPTWILWTGNPDASTRPCDLAWGQRSGVLERMDQKDGPPVEASLPALRVTRGRAPRPVALADLRA